MRDQQVNTVNVSQVNLETLFSDLPVMTDWYAGECYSALLVCLEHHKHKSGIETELRNLNETLHRFELVWTKPIEVEDRRLWGGPSNAAERAGEGMAWLIIHWFTDFTVIRRANKKTGVDFWLGHKEDVENLVYQDKARMEAKGRTELEFDSYIRRVVNQALEQTRQSESTRLAVYVVVTEFSRPVIYLVKNE